MTQISQRVPRQASHQNTSTCGCGYQPCCNFTYPAFEPLCIMSRRRPTRGLQKSKKAPGSNPPINPAMLHSRCTCRNFRGLMSRKANTWGRRGGRWPVANACQAPQRPAAIHQSITTCVVCCVMSEGEPLSATTLCTHPRNIVPEHRKIYQAIHQSCL